MVKISFNVLYCHIFVWNNMFYFILLFWQQKRRIFWTLCADPEQTLQTSVSCPTSQECLAQKRKTNLPKPFMWLTANIKLLSKWTNSWLQFTTRFIFLACPNFEKCSSDSPEIVGCALQANIKNQLNCQKANIFVFKTTFLSKQMSFLCIPMQESRLSTLFYQACLKIFGQNLKMLSP